LREYVMMPGSESFLWRRGRRVEELRRSGVPARQAHADLASKKYGARAPAGAEAHDATVLGAFDC